jgi:hypothetical protein
MALTDAKVRAAKPDEKPYKLADSGNMFLLVHPNGSRYWRLRYRFLGKEKTFALGSILKSRYQKQGKGAMRRESR